MHDQVGILLHDEIFGCRVHILDASTDFEAADQCVEGLIRRHIGILLLLSGIN